MHPASVALAGAGKAAVAIRIDRGNHAELPPVVVAALLKTLAAGGDVSFTAGKSTWRVSANGAVEALQQMDDVQGRTGRPSALVRRGGGSDADVASPMSVPRMESTRIPALSQPGDDALAVRVMASIQSNAGCPLLDDGAAQSHARLWHLDANRLLVTQACRAGAAANGYLDRQPAPALRCEAADVFRRRLRRHRHHRGARRQRLGRRLRQRRELDLERVPFRTDVRRQLRPVPWREGRRGLGASRPGHGRDPRELRMQHEVK